MASVNPPVVNFSGGIIGGELHNRVDIPTYPQGAEVMQNFRPALQGIMTRRPPMLHLDGFDDHDEEGRLFPFQYSIDASYLVLATETGFKFYANDGEITTPLVTASLLASWSDQSTGFGSVTVVGTKVFLDSDGASDAVAQKTITTSNTNTVHVLSFEVVHGPVNIRIGTTSGADNLLAYSGLRPGLHYLAFTPTGTTSYLQFWHEDNAGRIIRDTVTVLTGPDYVLPHPYLQADIRDIHYQQIRDVMYMTHGDYWPRRLERRGDRSWSIVQLLPDDGPFGDLNTTSTTIAASATAGEVTLTASDDLFESTDEGVLFSLTAGGQVKSETATTGDVYTDGIKVTGIGSGDRSFTITITISATASVALQRSSGNENSYATWTGAPSSTSGKYSSSTSLSIYDAQDNQTWYYRLAVLPGDYTSGTVTMEISYQGGSTTGIVRVVQYSSATSVLAEVIDGQNLPSTDPIRSWKKGSWNATDGFPNTISDGYARLWFGRGSRVWASKSDDFTSFDESDPTLSDSAFNAPLATPSSDAIRWMAMLNHLCIGTSSLEKIGVANTTQDPVGPDNFQTLPGSEEGGSAVQPVTATGSVLYVHRNKKKLMQLTPNPKALSETSYISVDLTARAPEIVDAEIVAMAVQREPERRIFVVLASGRLVELLFRREGELDVVAWAEVITDGRVEDVTVIPREDEDVVYFIVRRKNASGAWERFIERYGPERPLMDCDRYCLDAALGYELSKPETVATPSATTGTITVETDAAAFTAGDVNKILWINGGRGTITAYTSTTEVTVSVTSELLDTDPCPKYRWGIGTPTTSLSGADHLEGQTVTVWGDQTNLGTYTVSSGAVTLDQSVSVAYLGLAPRSRWKSLKLAYGAQKGTAVGMKKVIKAVTLLLYRTAGMLTYGHARRHGMKQSFQKMRPVPLRTPEVPYGEPVPLYSGEVNCAFDAQFDEDARLVFEIDGPAPCTISGYVPIIDERDK